MSAHGNYGAEKFLQKSYSLVIGSPADQYMCKKKARTEDAFSAGLPTRPERDSWRTNRYQEFQGENNLSHSNSNKVRPTVDLPSFP